MIVRLLRRGHLPSTLRRWAAVAATLCAVAPAFAAEVQFPLGGQLGLVPPPGLRIDGAAPGFRDPDHNVTMLILELPPSAYEVVRSQMITENAKKNGIAVDHRETLLTGLGAFLVSVGDDAARHERKWMVLGVLPRFTALITVEIPDAAKALYPDDKIRDALQTLAVRAPPVEEQLGLLPFKVTNLAGYRVAAVLNRNVVILNKGSPDDANIAEQPRVLIGIGQSETTSPADWPRLAEIAFAKLPGLIEQRITGSEKIRIDGTPAYELRALAKDAAQGTPLAIVQWLRFGAGAFVQIVGVTAKQNWERDFPSFRAVRDGVQPRS